MSVPVTDPAAIASIQAALTLAVYEARRLARLRLMGLAALPAPNPNALELLRRAQPQSVSVRSPRPRSSED